MLTSKLRKPVKGRIVARVPVNVSQTIEHAALICGLAVNQFIVRSAHSEALKIIEREDVIRLSRVQALRVFGLLDAPPKPNAAMKRAAANFKKLVREED